MQEPSDCRVGRPAATRPTRRDGTPRFPRRSPSAGRQIRAEQGARSIAPAVRCRNARTEGTARTDWRSKPVPALSATTEGRHVEGIVDPGRCGAMTSILLVEDDVDLQLLLQHVLLGAGYRVDTATGMQAGLALL